jgi:micrococcal nuclease
MYTGRVTRVKDGDTFEIEYQGMPLTIRLANIDVPEKNTPFGKQATQRVKELLEGKVVDFETTKLDNCGRHLCNMYLNGQRLDELFVREGLAFHWEKYSNNKNLVALEKQAFDAQIGIWQPEILETFFSDAWKKSQAYASV